jgi:hypothetical protein
MATLRLIGVLPRTVGLAVALMPAVGCGSELRAAPTGLPAHGAEAVVVEYPPPPAQVEHIDADPGSPCAWVDGHWNWVGRHWRWVSGGWVVPPPGCVISRPVLAWLPTEAGGTLYYWPPMWFRQAGGTDAGCPAPEPCGRAGPIPDGSIDRKEPAGQ